MAMSPQPGARRRHPPVPGPAMLPMMNASPSSPRRRPCMRRVSAGSDVGHAEVSIDVAVPCNSLRGWTCAALTRSRLRRCWEAVSRHAGDVGRAGWRSVAPDCPTPTPFCAVLDFPQGLSSVLSYHGRGRCSASARYCEVRTGFFDGHRAAHFPHPGADRAHRVCGGVVPERGGEARQGCRNQRQAVVGVGRTWGSLKVLGIPAVKHSVGLVPGAEAGAHSCPLPLHRRARHASLPLPVAARSPSACTA